MQTKLLFTRFVLILVLFSCGTTFAQLSPYQGIINPYERYGGLSGSYGGVIIAEPDAVPSPLDNPAGIAYQRVPQLFAGTTTRFTKYDFEYWRSTINESQPWESEFAPTQLAASYPLGLLHREAALAFSLGNIPAPEIETGYTTKNDTFPDMTHKRTGNVGAATIGISMKVTPSFNIGLSYTRWLGSWTWEDTEIAEQTKYGKGKYHYDGNSFTFGMIKQLWRFSLGVALQSPFTLMNAEHVTIREWEFTYKLNLEQQANGAATFGVSYRLSDQAKLGIGYRFQNKYKLVLKDYFETDVEETIDTHKLSVAGEYTMHLKNATIPVYLAYQRSWLQVDSDYIPGYMITSIVKEDEQIQNSLQFGINWFYKSLGVHLAGQWQQYEIRIYNEQLPPYS